MTTHSFPVFVWSHGALQVRRRLCTVGGRRLALTSSTMIALDARLNHHRPVLHHTAWLFVGVNIASTSLGVRRFRAAALSLALAHQVIACSITDAGDDKNKPDPATLCDFDLHELLLHQQPQPRPGADAEVILATGADKNAGADEVKNGDDTTPPEGVRTNSSPNGGGSSSGGSGGGGGGGGGGDPAPPVFGCNASTAVWLTFYGNPRFRHVELVLKYGCIVDVAAAATGSGGESPPAVGMGSADAAQPLTFCQESLQLEYQVEEALALTSVRVVPACKSGTLAIEVRGPDVM
jgi:hypothetical protein